MSNKLSWMVLGLIASFIGVRSGVAEDEKTYQFCYRFKVGQFQHYELTDRAELTTQTANNQSRAIQQTQCLKSFRVVTVDEEGGATFESVVESVRMASQTGDKAIVGYDSNKDDVVPKGFENLAGTIGRPLARFQVNSNGKLLKVTLLVNDVPKKFSDAAEKTDPAINFLVSFPEKPLKIGDKWNEKFDTQVSVGNNLNQELGMIRVFELVKVENEIATIRFRTSLRVPMHDPEILRQIVQQTPSGEIVFDLKEGQIISRSLVIDEKVIGAFGAQTLLQAQGEMQEKLILLKTAAKVSSTTEVTKPN
jgi:hypothetical protein